MLLGLDRVAMGGGGLPYITDGLTAMWDVEFVPPSTSRWNPVVGSAYWELFNVSINADGGVQFAGVTNSKGVLSSEIFDNTGTLTAIIKMPSVSSYAGIVIKTNTNCVVGIAFFVENQCAISNNVRGCRFNGDCFSGDSRYAITATYNSVAEGCYVNSFRPAQTGDDNIGGSLTVSQIGSRESSYSFSGSIYHLRWYNRVLSQSEILKNFVVDQDRFNLT